MKKYVLLIIMLFCCLNTYGNQKDKKYLEIKSTEKIDENKLSKYYSEKNEKFMKITGYILVNIVLVILFLLKKEGIL